MTLQQICEVSRRAHCLYSEAAVERALDNMAVAISAKIDASNPIVLCIMNGGLITTGKLATRLDFPLQLDYLHATRYRDQTNGSGERRWEAFRKLKV